LQPRAARFEFLSRRSPVNSKALTLAAVAAQVLLVVGAAQAGIGTVPVPEPTTMGLLGIGAAVAAVGAWWRHRK
jgi:hypothetical protein